MLAVEFDYAFNKLVSSFIKVVYIVLRLIKIINKTNETPRTLDIFPTTTK